MHRMLPLVAIAAGLVGCVMPPDAEYIGTPEDNAPAITDARPPPYLNFVDQATDCNRLYSANITDPDVNDTVYYRWFVDWHRHQAQVSDVKTVTPAQRDPQTQLAFVSFPVAGNDERFDALTSEPHIVELLVADRPFAPDPHTPPTSGKVTSIIWTVRWSTQKPPSTQCD